MVYYVEHAMLLLTVSNYDGYGMILCLLKMIVLYDALFILSHHMYEIIAFDIILSRCAHGSHYFQMVYFIIVQKIIYPYFSIK